MQITTGHKPLCNFRIHFRNEIFEATPLSFVSYSQYSVQCCITNKANANVNRASDILQK